MESSSLKPLRAYVLFGFTVLACAPSQQPEYPDLDTPLEPAPNEEQEAPPPPVAAKAVKRTSSAIHRADLTRVVDAGLGNFLQHVEVDALVEGGRFQGFRIVSLTPPEFWAGVDLRPGDVVTRINGMTIERPPQAYEAFTALKTARELVVSYLRQGQPRQLVFPIHPALEAPAPVEVEKAAEG